MKLKSLFVFLTVCLMVSALYAAPAAKTTYWDGSTSDWDDDDGQNFVDESSTPCDKPDGTTEVKIGGIAGFGDPRNTPDGVVTLDTTESWANIYSNRMRVLGNTTLNIVSTGRLTGPGWLRVGEKERAGASMINQTGGLLRLKAGGKDATRLAMGDSQDAEGLTSGTYVISGGTLTHTLGDATFSEGSIIIGDRGGTGTFKVIGKAPVINMGRLYVGGNIDMSGARQATGTLSFEVAANGVSAVVISDRVKLDGYGALSTAMLALTASAAITDPCAAIVLVNNTGTDDIVGHFDTLNGVNASEGLSLFLGGNKYELTYLYDADSDGENNDIALVWVPEPATIALLSLGLLAIRRKK